MSKRMSTKRVALCGLMLAMMLAIPCVLAETVSLPINLDPLTPPPEEYFISDHEYKDETLHVLIEEKEYMGAIAHVACSAAIKRVLVLNEVNGIPIRDDGNIQLFQDLFIPR